MDADSKFIASVIFEEWDKVAADLDTASPFYTKIVNGMISVKEQVVEGLPSWPYRTRELVFSPTYGGTATEGQRFDTYTLETFVLVHSYEFVRLLRSSKQTPAVKEAIRRLESVFDEALDEIARNIDADAFEVIDCDTLARVQLGSGLIVLNSVLESRSPT
jgi:hypothetical protein